MKRSDRIKLYFTRNWRMPGKERLAGWLKTSPELKPALNGGIIWLNDEDIAVYTTADNYIEHSILSTGTYEAEIGKLINISLKAGDVALDIGGNIGLQSIRMSRRCGASGKVLAFEPLNYLQAKFRNNTNLNRCDNITLFPLALSDEEQVRDIHIQENNWNQGTFSLAHNDTTGTTQQLDIKVGDRLPEIQALQQLHLIKIDVEGFEYQVMLGLKNTISLHKPRIIFEYDVNYWQRTGQGMAACYNFLTGMGYKLFQITQVACLPINKLPDATDGNILAIPQ